MKYIIINQSGATYQGFWDEEGGYDGLITSVEKTLNEKKTTRTVYYKDIIDGDEISIRTDEDVVEFVNHFSNKYEPIATIIIRESTQQQRSRSLFHNWSKGELLGVGAYGKVYLGINNETGDFFATKEVLLYDNSVNISNFRREINLMSPLSHTNIVQYFGTQETSTTLVVMMEYVPGGSISDLLLNLGPFTEHIIKSFSRQICLGMSYLHDKGILHLDIKGANCLVDTQGTVKVADFGCSTYVGDMDRGTKPLGTSLWMSPEAIKTNDKVSFATDIWSLACTVIEMATAKPPWSSAMFTNEWAAMYYISTAGVGPPIPSNLSQAANSMLVQCFALCPCDRPTVSTLLSEYSFFSCLELEPNSQTQVVRINAADNDHISSAFTPMDPVEYQSQPDCDTPLQYQQTTLQDRHSNLPPLPNYLIELPAVIDSSEATFGSAPPPPPLGATVGGVDIPVVIKEGDITSYLTTKRPQMSFLTQNMNRASDNEQTAFCRLEEGVVYKICFHLDAQSLCRMGRCSRLLETMTTTGRSEILWKVLFLHEFGDVSVIGTALRKDWKQFYSQSLAVRGLSLSPKESSLSFNYMRRLTHSTRIFEGKSNTGMPVCIKQEKKTWKQNENNNQHKNNIATPPKRKRLPGVWADSAIHFQQSPKKNSYTVISASDVSTKRVKESTSKHPRLAAIDFCSTYEYQSLIERVAIKKRDERREAHSALLNAYRHTKDLSNSGVEGILPPLCFINSDDVSVLVQPLSGPSLHDVLLFSGNKLDSKSVCLVALKCLRILEGVHNGGIVHCNLNPGTVLLKSDALSNDIVLNNFCSARTWRDKNTDKIVTSKSSMKIRSKEQQIFSSINIQLECTPSPRDDLISLSYTLLYFMHGTLPWLSGNPSPRDMVAMKKSYLVETAHILPLQLHHFLKYSSSMRANEMPDYSYLRNMFKVLLSSKGEESDQLFDWSNTSKLGTF